jgi:pimeloyl-ACP methyl ester carboxylesterase
MKYFLIFVALVVVALLAAGGYVWRHPMAIFNAMNRRDLKSAGFTRTQISTPVGTQITWEAGSGAPLVFLHGAGDHAGTWSKVAPEFKAQNHVIVIDMAGHGESDPRTGTLGIDKLLAGVGAVIEQRAGTQPVTIVGNSMGAWIAMLYAEKHPNRVARLVLVNGGSITGNRPDLAFMPQNREQARKLFDNIMDPASPKPPSFVLDDVVHEANNGPLARMMTAVNEWPTFLIQDEKLAQFKTPVDLVWGTADQMFPLDYAQRMEAQLPAVRLTEVPRCGHVPQQECPKTFTRTLKDVLAKPAPASLQQNQAKAVAETEKH